VAQYTELARELGQLLPGEDDGGAGARRGGGALDALPGALGNLHDVLLGAAARLGALHERVAAAKDTFLERRRAVRRPAQRRPSLSAQRSALSAQRSAHMRSAAPSTSMCARGRSASSNMNSLQAQPLLREQRRHDALGTRRMTCRALVLWCMRAMRHWTVAEWSESGSWPKLWKRRSQLTAPLPRVCACAHREAACEHRVELRPALTVQAGDDSDPFAEAEAAERRAAAAAARAPPAAGPALQAPGQPAQPQQAAGGVALLALPAPAPAPAPAAAAGQGFGGGLFGAPAPAPAPAAAPTMFGAPGAGLAAGGLFGGAGAGQGLLARSQSVRKGKSKK